MNIKEAGQEIIYDYEAGNASFLVGSSGLGKSDVTWQTFKKLQAREPNVNWGFGQTFLATQNPTHLSGAQYKGEKMFEVNGEQRKITVTDPACPAWMLSIEGKPAFCYDKFFLVFEEFGQADVDVKKPGSEILLKGGIQGWSLPQGSPRIGISNIGSRYGVTKDFDFGITRRSLKHIKGSVPGWLEWADHPYMWGGKEWFVSPLMKAWVASPEGSQHLLEDEPKEQGPWCNPRSACAGDRYMQVKARSNEGVFSTDPLSTESLSGTMGMPATKSLMNFAQYRLELPSYEDVVKDPEHCPVPTRPDLMLLMVYELATYTDKAHLGQCITYVQRMGGMTGDLSVTYLTAILRRDYRGIINHPAMQAWINKNASLVSIVAHYAQ